ncbi:F-box-like domain-containing protein [Legionella pneumophila]|uniref:F-box protein n=1 Tax=Legionella pneumophila subsp. pascullei TaxID=91890 RepID=A0AAX2IZA2_LEGPN|nr:F-box-like domain-containing protein [Legionella pneumophila]AMP89292.1 F-box protein [Legionella pneumophila subsp. pascullei]AMP93041.1 F-box protein [Legionella pneumophila subsp. pascullei]AMP96008.1 F-box protein [Legionella pneumophila subsp. pascullei]SQG90939.1 F-box protein [Legionella pneumophila subsp. pascullei]VEH07484.1 F-box protein [Legionella pneumophila subsp. pascullei]
MKKNFFSALPEETIINTLSFLKASTLGRVAQTCHFFNRLANDKHLELHQLRQRRTKQELWGNLMVAARSNNMEEVKKILKKGIDPTQTNSYHLNRTPLLAAIEGRAYQTANYLWRKYTFDPNFKDHYGDSPISLLKKQLANPAFKDKEKKQIRDLIKEMREEKITQNRCLVC